MNKIAEMDGFLLKENIGREAYQKFMQQVKPETEVVFNEEKYGHYDASYGTIEVEIKVREPYVNQFNTLVINQNKLLDMIQLIRDGKFTNGIYFNFVKNTDGKIAKAYFWTIRQIVAGIQNGSYLVTEKYAPKTTEGDTTKYWKKQIELPKNKAFEYEFDFQSNKWIKVKDGRN